MGDYSAVPVVNQIVQGGDKPLSVNAAADLSGDIYFSHREFIGNVTVTKTGAGPGLSQFQIQSFAINAGMQSTFPFMSQIAQNFILYEFNGLLFEYIPTSGEYGSSSSNSLGKVIMATQYDPDAYSFQNAVVMQNYDYAVSVKPSQKAIHGVETKPKQRATQMLYVRTGNTNKDLIFCDIGKFQVATEGIAFNDAGTAVIGELWVSYKIKLSRANLYGTYLNRDIKTDVFWGAPGANNIFQSSLTRLPTVEPTWVASYKQPATDNQPWNKNTNSIGCTITSNASNNININFPKTVTTGVFHLVLYMNLSAATGTGCQWNTASQTNCKVLTSAEMAMNNMFDTINSAETLLACNYFIHVNTGGGLPAAVELTLSAGVTITSTTTTVQLFISEVCTDCIMKTPIV